MDNNSKLLIIGGGFETKWEKYHSDRSKQDRVHTLDGRLQDQQTGKSLSSTLKTQRGTVNQVS